MAKFSKYTSLHSNGSVTRDSWVFNLNAEPKSMMDAGKDEMDMSHEMGCDMMKDMSMMEEEKGVKVYHGGSHPPEHERMMSKMKEVMKP